MHITVRKRSFCSFAWSKERGWLVLTKTARSGEGPPTHVVKCLTPNNYWIWVGLDWSWMFTFAIDVWRFNPPRFFLQTVEEAPPFFCLLWSNSNLSLPVYFLLFQTEIVNGLELAAPHNSLSFFLSGVTQYWQYIYLTMQNVWILSALRAVGSGRRAATANITTQIIIDISNILGKVENDLATKDANKYSDICIK